MLSTKAKRVAGRESSGLARAFAVVLALGMLTGCGGGEDANEGLSASERAEVEARMEVRMARDREAADSVLADTLGVGGRPLQDASGKTLTAVYDLVSRHGDQARAVSFAADEREDLTDSEAVGLFGLEEVANASDVIADGVRSETIRRANAAEEEGEPPYAAYSSPGEHLDAGGWGRFVGEELGGDLSRVPEADLREWLADEREGLDGGYGADALNLVGANPLSDGFADDWKLNLEEEAIEGADAAVRDARAAYAGAIEAELAKRARAFAGGG